MVLLRSPLSAGFLALVIGAGIWGLSTLKLQTELLPILPPDLPSVRGLTDFSRLAIGEDDVFAVVDPSISEQDRVKLLEKIRPALEATKGVKQVVAPDESIAKNIGIFAAWVLLNSPPEVFSSMTQSLDYEEARARLSKIPSQLAGAVDPGEIARLQLDPLGLLGETDGGDAAAGMPDSGGFLRVTPEHPLVSTADDTGFVDALQSSLDITLREPARGKVLLTGSPVFKTEISRQMRGDILLMVGSAIVLLVGTFYAFYRTVRPLGWIMFFQVLAMLCGIVVARLLYGGLNVISIGFASILLGVGMDYSILVYHHFAAPHRDDLGVWQTLKRSIWFSAIITSLSFFLLAFSSFPALRQLAVLVGTGLLTTALFATWLLRDVLRATPPTAPPVLFRASGNSASWILHHRGLLVALAFLAMAAAAMMRPWARHYLLYNSDLAGIRPVGSNAYIGQEWLSALNPSEGDAIYLLRGPSYDALRVAAGSLAHTVNPASGNPAWRIPSETNSGKNISAWSSGTADVLRKAFAEEGLGDEWSGPTLQMADTLDAIKRGEEDPFAAIADVVTTMAGSDASGPFAVVRISNAAKNPVPAGGFGVDDQAVKVMPVSWVSLTSEVTALAQRDFRGLGTAILAGIVLLCWLVHRSARLVVLNLVALALSMAIFIGLLRVTGARLTPISLISMPLLFGLVVDYSLHILLALEHQQGDLRKTYDHLAAPVLLTGLSACIGFGAPMLTGQPALQNFGLVMDLGVIAAVFACLVLLPPLYLLGRTADYRDRTFYRQLYQSRSFDLILFGWRLLGRSGAWVISRVIGLFYAFTHPSTVNSVRSNLALLDPGKATFGAACRVFVNQAENFSSYGRLALLDRPIEVLDLLGEKAGLSLLKRAQREGRGCILVTGHFGFFEIGGLVMAQMGFPVVALTLPEPADGLTEWRADFRARWGVDTLVVGNSSLSAVEIVKHLRDGAFVASLADRPHDGNSVAVALPHGQMHFATGPALLGLLAKCPIIPVTIVRQRDGKYRMNAISYIEPHWLESGKQATIEHYTREIAKALVPAFVEYPDQWFHFARVSETPHTSVVVHEQSS